MKDFASEIASKSFDLAKQNPGLAVIATVGAVGVSMVAAPGLAAVPAFTAGANALGFGAGGVVAGSTAAGIQSGIGSVVAPSLFATVQSAAMGGYGVAAVVGGVQALGGAMAAGAGAAGAWIKWK